MPPSVQDRAGSANGEAWAILGGRLGDGEPADKPAERAVMTECVYTYTLPDGEISGQGLVARPELSEVQVPGVDAVIGGTGKYVGVEGEVHHETRGNAVIATFYFID
jgi:hypothetical protein